MLLLKSWLGFTLALAGWLALLDLAVLTAYQQVWLPFTLSAKVILPAQNVKLHISVGSKTPR